MLRITEKDYNELMDIMDGYVEKLNELSFDSEEYRNLKWELDNKFCGINITTEHQIIHAELEIGNVIIKDDVLTCIYNNSIHSTNYTTNAIISLKINQFLLTLIKYLYR